MQFLLIDNSNSWTKFTLASGSDLSGEVIKVATNSLNAEKLKEVTSYLQYDAVVVGSVVPLKAKLLADFFDKTACHFVTYKSAHGIVINLTKPDQVGADRIANAVGVISLFKAPAIVIDFGTAVTFDVILEGGIYQGGVIAPGLGSMNDYLSAKTALLPKIELSEPKNAIGKTTREAMLSGAVFGYRGMVKGIIEAITQELKNKPLIISTGGDGKIIADGIKEINHFSSQITLEGLRVIATKVF